MLYQKILMENAPYQLGLGPIKSFVPHRHTDIEINYCIRGSREVIIDKSRYVMNAGDVALISSGVSHEFPPEASADRLILTGVFGSSFLKKHFSAFSQSAFKSPIITLDESRRELKTALDSLVALLSDGSPKSELLITSELYRVCALLLDELKADVDEEKNEKNGVEAVARIDEALEMIYYDYKKPVTVDDAAAATGYGKSNFCKIFKNTTGFGFHEALNRRRIAVAEGLLSETSLSVSEIAAEVGFAEAKSFCRVFKAAFHMTPGEYRRAKKEKTIS